jgi:RNA polymerase sigma-70 factor, ECF subfamily
MLVWSEIARKKFINKRRSQMPATVVRKISPDAETRNGPERKHYLRLVSRPPTDYELAQAAAGGGTIAMADLYERHNRRVYGVCLSMTRNAAEAEDLTHEVFIHLFRKIGSFRGQSQFSTWLHRLTVNLVLMRFRRKDIRRENNYEDVDSRLTRGPKPALNEQLVNRMALISAVAQLPPGCRAVFVLFDVQGYGHEEIARLLGCSSGTSKSQLHRARIKLRKLLRTRASR